MSHVQSDVQIVEPVAGIHKVLQAPPTSSFSLSGGILMLLFRASLACFAKKIFVPHIATCYPFKERNRSWLSIN